MPSLAVLWNTIAAGTLLDRLVDAVDILLVSFIIYEALIFVRGTRAAR